jgi:nucleotide-binding universal stress UspA family protein
MKNKVIIAVDISESTDEVIQKGIDFASKMNASIVIASIVPIYVDYLQSQMALVPTQWDEIYTAQKDFALKELQKIREEYNYADITLYVEIGNAKYDILEKAEKEEATYIVVGTHGRTGLSHVFIGSTAEYIVRHATVPVLVIPIKKEK